jgi:hypothetical protein
MVRDTKCISINHLTHCRVCQAEAITSRQNLESDPPEVSYLLIIATLAEGLTGSESDLRPTP